MDSVELINQLKPLEQESRQLINNADYRSIDKIYNEFCKVTQQGLSLKLSDRLACVISSKNITHPASEGKYQMKLASKNGFQAIANAGGNLFASLAQIATSTPDSYIENDGDELNPHWHKLYGKTLLELIQYTIKAVRANDPSVLDELL